MPFITMKDGILIPSRSHTKEVLFQEAIRETKLLSSNILYETSTDDVTAGSVYKRFKKILSTLIDKVIGFFKGLISKIRGYTLSKTRMILSNKKHILTFSDEDNTLSMILPENILKPANPVNIEWFYKSITDVINTATTVLSTNEVPSYEKSVSGVPTSTEITDNLMSKILNGFKKHMRSRSVIKSHIYGSPASTYLDSLDKQELIKQFIKIDKDVNDLQKLYDISNENLTKMMRSLGYAGYHRDATDNIEQKSVEFYVNSYAAILEVTNSYISVLMSVYNDLYAAMDTMINASKGTDKK